MISLASALPPGELTRSTMALMVVSNLAFLMALESFVAPIEDSDPSPNPIIPEA